MLAMMLSLTLAAEPGRELIHPPLQPLIAKLGSERFAEREAASRALLDVGEPALSALLQASLDAQDLETRRRAEQLFSRIERECSEPALTLRGHDDAVNCLTFSADGRFLASASDDRTARVWHLQTGRECYRFEAGSGVNATAFSPDRRYLLVASKDARVRLWEMHSGRVKWTRGTNISPDLNHIPVFFDSGDRLLLGGADGRAINAGDGLHRHQFTHQSFSFLARLHPDVVKGIRLVASSPRGDLLLTSASFDDIRLWDSKSFAQLHRLAGHPNCTRCAAFSPDGQSVLTVGEQGDARRWRLKHQTRDGELVSTTDLKGNVFAAVFHRSLGPYVLSGDAKGTVMVWHFEEDCLQREFSGHSKTISCLAASPDGRFAAAAAGDVIQVWNMPRCLPATGKSTRNNP
ncbi:MAG: WD40 repeat domain-containing protein [Gemmataceae bacterium]